jgi:PAS domain S-box-containing protein
MRTHELFALLDAAGDAAFAVEPCGSICYWSANAEKLLGFSSAETLEKNCASIIDGHDDAGCQTCSVNCRVIEMARTRGAVAAYDLHAATASGERKWVNVSVIVANVAAGPSPLVVHLMRNIEARKKTEKLTREIIDRVADLTGREANDALRRSPSSNPSRHLTSQEANILRSLARGRNTSEIAKEFHISPSTVRNHVQHVLQKLQCHTRLEAVIRAAREGLI